jgi:NitT/TauT family transport system ATP-binding protein
MRIYISALARGFKRSVICLAPESTMIGPGTRVSAVLEGRDLAYRYPGATKPVFADINLLTKVDEFIAIVGPTGTGKSTLLRVLAQLLPQAAGEVFLDGVEVTRPSPKISLVHQSIATFPWMTALDNVKLVLAGTGMEEQEAVALSKKMLSVVGLQGFEGHYPKEMSGGMRQRVAIARALAASPEVLLLDEPFVHLDELTANEIRKEVYNLVFNPATTLKSAVLVSHNLHEVVQLADRVYIMNSSPAIIVDIVKIDLPRPRTERDPGFLDCVDELYKGLNLKTAKP